MSTNNVMANLKTELQKISDACHTPYETIAKDFIQEYKSDFVQKDKQFSDDKARYQYCLSVVTIRYGDRMPVQPYNLIPVGVGSIRTDKSGKKYINIFVLINGIIRRVMVKNLKAIDNLLYDSEYKNVLLSAFEKDSTTCDLSADERAIFEKPIFVDNFDIETFAKIEEVQLEELDLYPSKTDKSGWALNSDWKKVHAFIAGKMSGLTKEEKGKDPWGMYRLKTGYGSIAFESGKITDSVVSWIDPVLMRYEIESECYFYGPTSVDTDGTPSMNTYRIKPIHAKEVEIK